MPSGWGFSLLRRCVYALHWPFGVAENRLYRMEVLLLTNEGITIVFFISNCQKRHLELVQHHFRRHGKVNESFWLSAINSTKNVLHFPLHQVEVCLKMGVSL